MLQATVLPHDYSCALTGEQETWTCSVLWCMVVQWELLHRSITSPPPCASTLKVREMMVRRGARALVSPCLCRWKGGCPMGAAKAQAPVGPWGGHPADHFHVAAQMSQIVFGSDQDELA